jgi:NAD(P)-dependent dehydrogenase (short-subunit alcohol dehydrogenase family)
VSRAPRSLAGKVVAITGGARGIGRATAAALIVQGARVAIGDIDPELAERSAKELGGGTIALELDVTDRASFANFLDQVEQRLGPLDVLVNNAGIMPVGPFAQETDAMAARMIGINLEGVIFGSKLALERFLTRRSGHLVNIASIAGKLGVPGGATYCATKHAVVGLSEAIRGEVHGTGISVSVVMPIGVNTELYSGLPQPRGFRTVEPEEVAEAIVAALQSGRYEVYVPRSLAVTARLNALMPTRVTDLFGRVLGSDRVLLSADHTIRGAYEQRMAQTEAGTYAGPAAAKAQPAQTDSKHAHTDAETAQTDAETAPPERVTESV